MVWSMFSHQSVAYDYEPMINFAIDDDYDFKIPTWFQNVSVVRFATQIFKYLIEQTRNHTIS